MPTMDQNSQPQDQPEACECEICQDSQHDLKVTPSETCCGNGCCTDNCNGEGCCEDGNCGHCQSEPQETK